MSFLVHVHLNGKEVALLSSHDLGAIERIDDLLRPAGFVLTVKHQPAAVVITRTKTRDGKDAT